MSELARTTEEKLYKVYITDCLCGLCGGKKRFCDIVYRHDTNIAEREKSGDDIALDIIKRHNLKFSEEGGD